MSTNPYESPDVTPNHAAALQAVANPAVCLLVNGAIGIPLQLLGIVNNAMSIANPAAAMQGPAGPPEGVDPQMLSSIMQGAGVVGIVFNLIAIAIAAFVITSALKMKKLEGLGRAKFAAGLSMIPCLSPCCVLGLPFGIWALVVLGKPEVSSAFK